MTALDYFVGIVVVVSVAIGALRGIIRTILSILSVLAGLIIAAHFYPISAPLFGAFTASPQAAGFLGFVSIFLLVLLAGAVLARVLRSRVKRAHLSWVDHGLGALFGLLRGWLVCSVVYLALTAFPVKLEAVEQASFGPELLEGTRVISYLASPDVKERFVNGYGAVNGTWRAKNSGQQVVVSNKQ